MMLRAADPADQPVLDEIVKLSLLCDQLDALGTPMYGFMILMGRIKGLVSDMAAGPQA